MKERIKKFWNDRKDREKLMIVVGTGLAGYVVAMLALNDKSDRYPYGIASVYQFTDENQINRVLVGMNDGTIHSFHKHPKKV